MRFDLFTQLQVGKTWIRLLRAEGLQATIDTIYLVRCPFVAPADQLTTDLRASQGDTVAWLNLADNRIPNGETLLDAIADGTHATWLTGLPAPDRSALNALGQQLPEAVWPGIQPTRPRCRGCLEA